MHFLICIIFSHHDAMQFHNNGDSGYIHNCIQDLNHSHCKIRAYCRLKQFKIYDSDAMLNFYDFILAINSVNCAPYLDAFQYNTDFLYAILIKYLSNSLIMNCVTYTTEYMQKAVIDIQQIHLTLVKHNDSYSKNILIVSDNQERVI